MRVKLSMAQRQALEVLASPHTRARGGLADGWKKSSRERPLPRVNYLAARKLVELGLAESVLPVRFNPFTHDTRYRITAAGRQELAG